MRKRLGFLQLIATALAIAVAFGMARFDATANQWVRGDDITPVASAARTTSGNSGTLDAKDYNSVDLFLDVTAASGTTPSLAVTIEHSADGTTWVAAPGTAFGAKTAVSSERQSYDVQKRYWRVVWTITGTTPSFTFSVTGQAK